MTGRPPTPSPGAAPAVVHVVRVPHEEPGEDARSVLAPTERVRAERYRRAEDRRRSLTAALLLRHAVGALTGLRPADVDVRRTCASCGVGDHGRPALPGTGWHASVSHAGAWCVVALTTAGPVGVDVEVLRALDTAGLGAAVLGPGEHARDAAALLRLWTRKEAVVKATGAGVGTPFRDVLVGPADWPAALRGCPGVPPGTGLLRDIGAPAGHVAAVCVLPAPAPHGDATASGLDVRELVVPTPDAAGRALARASTAAAPPSA
ncbi:4'-phosphopantetheinyl transferase superfamily protein [Cellulomonas sp. JZ18]|uniref:4'-phosphopantetheinyl transferase family protein n=1 Tax=Cellulomonas sp. JZ18 TaxID=2654191 RepID=UPI0018AF9EF6|nr:4'-phosphopantetheinyl transferase superfamily protein [Cellulomonas sp. JZ18]